LENAWTPSEKPLHQGAVLGHRPNSLRLIGGELHRSNPEKNQRQTVAKERCFGGVQIAIRPGLVLICDFHIRSIP
jgi:hypothetical protein